MGQKFDAVIKRTNVGKEAFPGGRQTVSIRWSSNQSFTFQHEIPRLAPNETHEIFLSDLDVLAPGYILFFFSEISAADKRGTGFTSGKGLLLNEGYAFHSVVARTPEEIYQYWAMLIAAFSLLILVAERVISLLLSFFAFI